MSERRGRACRQRGGRGGDEKERVVGGGWAGRRVRGIWILRCKLDCELPLGSGNKDVGACTQLVTQVVHTYGPYPYIHIPFSDSDCSSVLPRDTWCMVRPLTSLSSRP